MEDESTLAVTASAQRETPVANVLLDIVQRHGDERRADADARAKETEILGRLMNVAEKAMERRLLDERRLALDNGAIVPAATSKSSGGPPGSPPRPKRMPGVQIAKIAHPPRPGHFAGGPGGRRDERDRGLAAQAVVAAAPGASEWGIS